MADPLSILGVLVAVAQVTPAVVSYIRAFKHATPESRQLLLEINSTSGVVALLRDLANESSQDDAWSPSLESLREMLGQYEMLLRKIAERLEKNTGSKRDALTWLFEKKAVGETLVDLERYKTGFLLALQNIQTEVSYSIKRSFGDIRTDIQQIRESQQEKDFEKILQWLSPLDPLLVHNDTLRRRHVDTGGWILRESSFQRWAFGDLSTLCCEGIAGAGKTIIASVVIDHLKRDFEAGLDTSRWMDAKAKSTGSCVLCLYCIYKERNSQTTENLVGSLLKQMIENHPQQFFPMVETLYNASKQSHERPVLNDFVSLLGNVLQSFTQSYLVVDALDECTMEVKDSLMNTIEVLQQTCALKVMITLRPDTYTNSLEPSKTGFLEIRAQDSDIRKYLVSRIRSERRSFRTVRGPPDHEAYTVDTILARSQGMFLLARLHLDSIAKSINPKTLMDSLRSLPREINATYDEAMLRLSPLHQDEEHFILAKKVLAWMVYASRSLTVLELQYALAVESTELGRGIDEDYIINSDHIVSSCAGLITIDKESNVIRMVHHSAQEYFFEHRSTLFPNGHLDIAAVCLKYLTSEALSRERCADKAELASRLEMNPFLEYAACNWGHHARESGENAELISTILKFMQMHQNISYATQIAASDFIYDPWSEYDSNSPILPALVVAAHFGLQHVAASLLDRNIDVNETTKGIGALSVASQGGHDKVVNVLLAAGADARRPQRLGISALHRAASCNHPKVVEILLSHDRNIIESRNVYGKVALHDAAERGLTQIVEILLQHGANSSIIDNDSHSPLSFAAASGNMSTVLSLLATGIPVDASKPEVFQATYTAAGSSHIAILQLLFDRGAAVDSRSVRNNTILHGAVCGRGDPMIIRLIMEQEKSNTIVNALNIYHKAPIHDAAERNQLAAVSVLLEYDPEMAPDIDGLTPLHWAVSKNHIAMTRLLLQKPRDQSFINKRAGPKFRNMTALEMAVDKQRIEIVQILSEALLHMN